MSAVNGLTQDTAPAGVHIVGSVPLPSAKDVFTTLSSTLPGRLRRMPDGETGARQSFTLFQRDVFSAAPQALRQYDASFSSVDTPLPDPGELDAAISAIQHSGPPSTQYDTNALASYQTFKALQDAGTIGVNVKFQVSLPSPLDVIVLLADGYQAALEPLYEAHLLTALRDIEAAIPHDSLSIQWDVASAFAMLEGAFWPHFRPWFSPVRAGIIERVARQIRAVIPDVEVGLHLCYGDIGHRHFFEPKDAAKLVDIANEVQRAAGRRVDFIHMPVPKERDDAQYLAPVKALEVKAGGLFLGLVHHGDLEGTRRRIKTAAEVLDGVPFGVATECGMGRTPPEQLTEILEICAAVSRPFEK